MCALHVLSLVPSPKHEAHTVVADASYPHEAPVSERHEEQSVCVEHTDVVVVKGTFVDVVVVIVVVVVAGQLAALAVVSSTHDPELTVHPYAALHRTASYERSEQASHSDEVLV